MISLVTIMGNISALPVMTISTSNAKFAEMRFSREMPPAAVVTIGIAMTVIMIVSAVAIIAVVRQITKTHIAAEMAILTANRVIPIFTLLAKSAVLRLAGIMLGTLTITLIARVVILAVLKGTDGITENSAQEQFIGKSGHNGNSGWNWKRTNVRVIIILRVKPALTPVPMVP
jgi:hypothetical protein